MKPMSVTHPPTTYGWSPLLVAGQSATNGLPPDIWVETLAHDTATLRYTYTGEGVASNFTHHTAFPLSTAWEVTRPSGGTTNRNNCAVWWGEQTGLTFDCKISPDLPNTEIYWFLDANDFPAGPETKITWNPWDVKNNRPHVGVGTNPKLKVTYENPQSKYMDFMPPDNRWFGQKKITVQVGNQIVIRPIWFFFHTAANRINRQGGKMEFAWFHYYKGDRVVPALEDMGFEFDDTLAVNAKYTYSLPFGNRYYVGPRTHLHVAQKSVFDVNDPNSYSEVDYPNKEGKGAHAVAKLCEHEWWHAVLDGEVRWLIFGGLGHADSDWDWLSNDREAEFGTNPNVKDTCGLLNYDPDYNVLYSSYADQELFCRWKEIIAPKGNAAKDWALNGTQYPSLIN